MWEKYEESEPHVWKQSIHLSEGRITFLTQRDPIACAARDVSAFCYFKTTRIVIFPTESMLFREKIHGRWRRVSVTEAGQQQKFSTLESAARTAIVIYVIKPAEVERYFMPSTVSGAPTTRICSLLIGKQHLKNVGKYNNG